MNEHDPKDDSPRPRLRSAPTSETEKRVAVIASLFEIVMPLTEEEGPFLFISDWTMLSDLIWKPEERSIIEAALQHELGRQVDITEQPVWLLAELLDAARSRR